MPFTAQTITLRRADDGRAFASNFTGEYGVNFRNQWAWTVSHVCAEFCCDEDDVALVETDAGDMVTVRGLAVAFTEYSRVRRFA